MPQVAIFRGNNGDTISRDLSEINTQFKIYAKNRHMLC